MKHLSKFLFVLLFLNISTSYSQGGASSCAELEANFQLYQSCATNTPFQNSTGSNTEVFNTTCIEEQFHGPTWFFMEIQTPGDIQLQISQVNNAGIGTDVDFVLWGPFNNLNNICSQLNPATEVDCSWLSNSIEFVNLPNGVTGQLYVLLVDNFSNQPGNISITQTGGTGSSNCDFLSSVKILDTSLSEITQFDYCKPSSKDIVAKIDVTDFPGLPANLRFNYKWYKDGILISTITDSTLNTNTLTTTETGVYKVESTAYDSTDPTVIIGNLTVSSDEIDLKFHATPAIAISNTNTQCLQTSPILQAAITNQASLNNTVDVLTYQWYLNNNPIAAATNQNYTPTVPGDYFVRVFNSPCSTSDSNLIHIFTNPSVTISADQIICEGSSYTITPNIANNGSLTNIVYQWFKNGVSIAGATNQAYTVSAANQALNTTAIYTLQVTEQNLCSTISNPVSITINALPTVNTTPIRLEQCDFINPTLDGVATTDLSQLYNSITNNTAGLTLYYYQDAGFTIPILDYTNYTNTSSPFTQNIYVKAVNENVIPNCPSLHTAVINLVINPTSIALYPDISAVCPELNANYGTINFDAQRMLIKNNYFPVSPVDISFYLDPNHVSTGINQVTNSTSIPAGIHTIYTRIETNTNCTGIGQFQVEVYAAPLQNTVSQSFVCVSDTFLLNTKDAEALIGQNTSVQTSYFNSFDDAKGNVNQLNKNTPFAITTGTRAIFIRLFDTNTQCVSIINFNLNVLPDPAIFNPLPIKSCGTTTADFNLNSSISFITGNNANYQVRFYETNADLAADNFITTPAHYNSGTKTIIVKVLDPTNHGCDKTTTLSLVVLHLPGATNNPTPLELCEDSGFSSFDLTSRESEMANPTPIADVAFRYYKDITDAANNNNNFITNPATFTNTTVNYQKIYVRLNSKTNFNSETGEACHTILELELFVRPYPANHLLESYIICVDRNNVPANPAIINTQLPTSDYSFIWHNGFDAVPGNEISGESSNAYTTSTVGEYSVKITNTTNAALCSTVANFKTENSYIPFSITGEPSELIAFEAENTVTAIVIPQSPDYLYSMDNTGWQTSNVFTNITAGEHTITVTNKYNCGAVSTQIVLVDYPKFFTPNGDGYHDTWNIGGTQALESIQIHIFDRFGKFIKEINPNSGGWNGTFNGTSLPASDYWFKLKYRKNQIEKEFKGHFALKR
ncbi:T9SS type B sorting domain-containing protein [Flavobacterium sp.]|uniref:T9SS type B sorting domain-containing protein n=1 Tax=Flavobacterium sp. TaxID=239 RepID=UPI003D6AF0FC